MNATRISRWGRPATFLALSCSAALALAGCGATIDASSEPERRTVNIENCSQPTSYTEPVRPVAYDISAIEKMFVLGLADRLHGIVLPKTVQDAADRSPFKKEYASVDVISDDVLSQETLVASKADWVFAGWQAGFSEERGVTPESLQRVGINNHMQLETCRDFGEGGPAIDPLEASYEDLTVLGEIFNVQEKAASVVTGLRERATQLSEAPEVADPANIFVYDSGTNEPYTAGKRTAPNTIIELAGGEPVMKDLDARWANVGWESVVNASPDVIMVVNYAKQPVEDKINYLKTQSPLKNSPAVLNNRIKVLDYGQAVSGPRNLDAAEDLANYLRAEGF